MYTSSVYYGEELIKEYNRPISQEDIETILRTEMLYRDLDRAEMLFSIDFSQKYDSRVFVMDFDEKLFTSYSIEEYENIKNR